MNQVNQYKKEIRKYLTKYDYTKVIEYCDKILEIQEESSYAYRYKAISYSQMGKVHESIDIYMKLQKLHPNDTEITYSLALLNQKLGNYNESLHYYDRLDKNNSHIQTKRKHLLYKMKEYDKLLGEYPLFDRNQSTYSIMGVLEEKSIIYYRKKEYDEAYRLLSKVSQLYPKAIKERTNPLHHNRQWYDRLAVYLERYDDSKEFFTQFLKIEDNAGIWEIRMRRSLTYADDYFFADVVLESNPDNTSLLYSYARGLEYYESDFSLDCYSKILEIEPDNEYAIDETLSIYAKEYAKDKAIRFIDTKLENSHIRKYLLNKKIELLESMTLYPEALKTYRQYFKYATPKERQSIYMDYLLCMELYAWDLYNRDKHYESYTVYKQILRKTGKTRYYKCIQYQPAWYDQVLRPAITNSHGSAEEFFNELLSPNEKQTTIWVNKLDSVYDKFKHQKSIGNKSYFDVLSEKNPENLQLHLHMARKYYHGLHKPSRALPLFDRVLRIDPDNREVLNHKFVMLVSSAQYMEAYNLLSEIEIDYHVIAYELNKLTEYFIKNREYARANYCLNIKQKQRWDYKTLKIQKDVWNRSNDKESQKESPYCMDWISLLNFKHEEYKCPHCGGKLIPIRYGVFTSKDLKLAKYHISDKINTHHHRPTDYCTQCHKEVYMGICGIDLTEDNHKQSNYAKEIIIHLTKFLEENPEKTIEDVKKELYSNYALNHQEFQAFIDKLEEIKYITNNGKHLALCDGYSQFKHSINEKYHYRTRIFENKKELMEYSDTCNTFREYEDLYEYIEDIKISLINSSWHYTYQQATEILKGDECELRGAYDAKIPPDEVAVEVGYMCG